MLQSDAQPTRGFPHGSPIVEADWPWIKACLYEEVSNSKWVIDSDIEMKYNLQNLEKM